MITDRRMSIWCKVVNFCKKKKKKVRLYLYNGRTYRAFSLDVTAAILVFQNNKTAAMLVYRTNPEGVELFSYVNASFCFNTFA